MQYLKWGYIDPETKTPGLKEAFERLEELKMTVEDRKAYEEHLETIMYQNDVLGAARRDGRIESALQIAQKMLDMGMGKDAVIKATGITDEIIERFLDNQQ